MADASDNFDNFRSFFAIFLLLKKIQIWPFLVLFFTSDDYGWPQMTSRLTFFEKTSSRASFLGINCLLLLKYWNLTLFSRFLTSGDLEWPWYQLSWKADAKSFILRYDLPTFKKYWNLTPFSRFLTSRDLEWPCHQLFWKADAKSFILRY